MEYCIREESAPAWTSPAPGVRVRPLVEGDGTTLMLYQIAPGTRFGLHAHPFPELGLVISGAGIVLVEGDERSAVGGDSYYFPAGMEHGFVVPDDGEPVVMLDVSAAVGSELPPKLSEAIARMAFARGTPGIATIHTRGELDGPSSGEEPFPAPPSRSRTPRPSH